MKCTCKESASCLAKLLANSYVLMLKTQNIHWNVKGSDFRSIHLMTEEHYDNLFEAIDVIAEAIKMTGEEAPATFKEYLELADITDVLSAKTSREMLEQLLADHMSIRDSILGCQDSAKCCGLADSVLTDRLNWHLKIIWMLSATLAK